MESKNIKISSDKITKIVSDMNNTNFNNHNPLIQDLLNHVEIESSINREIPQVQNKVDLITSQQENNNITQQNNYSNDYDYEDENDDEYENENEDENYENDQNKYYNNDETQSKTINIAKLFIISLIIIAILCYIIYKYINKYKYIIMCCTGAAILASDYFIGKKFEYF